MATSTAVKRRYNEKTYSRWFCDLKKDEFANIEELRKKEGLSRAEFLKKLVAEHYDNKKE